MSENEKPVAEWIRKAAGRYFADLDRHIKSLTRTEPGTLPAPDLAAIIADFAPQPLLCANCNDVLDGDEDAYCGACVPPGTFEPAPQPGLTPLQAARLGAARVIGCMGRGGTGTTKTLVEVLLPVIQQAISQAERERDEATSLYHSRVAELSRLPLIEHRSEMLRTALAGLYGHTKNNMVIAGLNQAAKQALADNAPQDPRELDVLRNALKSSSVGLERVSKELIATRNSLGKTEKERDKLKAEVEAKHERAKRAEDEIDDCLKRLKDNLDRDKDPTDSLRDLVCVAINGIYWRDKEVAELKEALAKVRRIHDAAVIENVAEVERLNAELLAGTQTVECRHSAGVTHTADYCPFCEAERLRAIAFVISAAGDAGDSRLRPGVGFYSANCLENISVNGVNIVDAARAALEETP